jgi:hypothetical protein
MLRTRKNGGLSVSIPDRARRFSTPPFDRRAEPVGLVSDFPPQLPHHSQFLPLSNTSKTVFPLSSIFLLLHNKYHIFVINNLILKFFDYYFPTRLFIASLPLQRAYLSMQIRTRACIFVDANLHMSVFF